MDSRKEMIKANLGPCRGCEYNKLKLDGWVYCTKGRYSRKVFYLKQYKYYIPAPKCIYVDKYEEEYIEWIAEKV